MFIKIIMEIGSGDTQVETVLASNIQITNDLDELAPTMTFNLPYKINSPELQTVTEVEEGLDVRNLKKYDTVKLYFNEFDKDPGDITIESHSADDVEVTDNFGNILFKIFDGYIDSLRLSIGKNSVDYSITALGSLAITNERNAPIDISSVTLRADQALPYVLQVAGLQIGGANIFPVTKDLIPTSRVFALDTEFNKIFFSLKGGKNAKSVIDSIKSKYGAMIFQSGDGFVYMITPFYLIRQTSIDAWDFDLAKGNVFEVQYGDLTSHINAVVVLGYPGVYGMTIDPVAVQRNDGKINYQIFEQADLANYEDCEKVARNKLLEIERNNTISFRTKFKPDYKLTQFFKLKEYNKLTGNELFLIKTLNITISKNDVSCMITGYSHSLTTLPEDLVLSPTGIADIDTLEAREKLEDANVWNDFGGL